ncbi:MAG TPA: YeeE/YedE thiosulfate transporter family protein [Saprospiraceae bacterium]|nr:YeeE/YedE family protein [Lewinellaceae bacterium]HPQ21429.1 YeeE/YedE thiosulfate transporter family protein [Saprospiraceae bacterium]
MEFILQPWPWFISGLLITFVTFLLLYFGKVFGISSNLRTMCTILGGGKFSDFFRFDWKSQKWNLFFIAGVVIGGFVASHYLSNNEPIKVAENTVQSLNAIGITVPTEYNDGKGLFPEKLFGNDFTLPQVLILLFGGLMVGFGARYGGGCTSGHAISGLSNLQLPSLIAVIGFFIGGLLMTHILLPFILNLL